MNIVGFSRVLYLKSPWLHREGGTRKRDIILSRNVDKKWLDKAFLIAICQHWQSKTLFLAIFDQPLLIIKSIFDCRLSSVVTAKDKMF